MIELSLHEKKIFEQWVIENVDESLVPSDEGNGDALAYNLIHKILGDGDRYDYLPTQDMEIETWEPSRPGIWPDPQKGN